jgi:hypothetical protein
MRKLPVRRHNGSRIVARVEKHVLRANGDWETPRDPKRVANCAHCGREYPHIRGRTLCSDECHELWREEYVFKRKKLKTGCREDEKVLPADPEPVRLTPEQLDVRSRMRYMVFPIRGHEDDCRRYR